MDSKRLTNSFFVCMVVWISISAVSALAIPIEEVYFYGIVLSATTIAAMLAITTYGFVYREISVNTVEEKMSEDEDLSILSSVEFRLVVAAFVCLNAILLYVSIQRL